MIMHIRALFPYANIKATANVEEAKSILNENNFDVLFLDHDLGGKAFVDSNEENTGYQLSKFIDEAGIKYKLCVVHSLNYPGAMRMMKNLKNSFYLPVIMWNKENLDYTFKLV